MTRKKAAKRKEIAMKYVEATNKFIEKACKAGERNDLELLFFYERIIVLLIEKTNSFGTDFDSCGAMMRHAEVVISYGSQLKPERHCQLNEMAMEIFRSIEAGFENCVD